MYHILCKLQDILNIKLKFQELIIHFYFIFRDISNSNPKNLGPKLNRENVKDTLQGLHESKLKF